MRGTKGADPLPRICSEFAASVTHACKHGHNVLPVDQLLRVPATTSLRGPSDMRLHSQKSKSFDSCECTRNCLSYDNIRSKLAAVDHRLETQVNHHRVYSRSQILPKEGSGNCHMTLNLGFCWVWSTPAGRLEPASRNRKWNQKV